LTKRCRKEKRKEKRGEEGKRGEKSVGVDVLIREIGIKRELFV